LKALIPSVSVAPSGSDLSLDKDPDRKKEKKTVKDKLTGMFKKGSSSRTSRLVYTNLNKSLFVFYFWGFAIAYQYGEIRFH